MPAGGWVQWWTGERVDGPAHVLAHAPLGRPALYARANAAIPLWPARDHTGFAQDELTLRVFAVPGAPPVERALYEDAGEGYGEAARRTVWMQMAKSVLVMDLRIASRMVARRSRISLVSASKASPGTEPPPATAEVDTAAAP